MEEIKNLLKEREKYLRELKSKKEKELKTAPEGLLRVCSSRNRIQYYHRTDPKDFNGVYIKEKNIHLFIKIITFCNIIYTSPCIDDYLYVCYF